MKAYADYKPSGVEWLGEVPSHWNDYPFWAVFKEKSITNQIHENLLSVYLDKGVIPYSEGGGLVHKPSESLEKYQLVEQGDFVMNNQQAWRGSVGISVYKGIVSPAYLIFKPNKNLFISRYLHYLLRDKFMVSQFEVASLSVGTIQRQIKNHLLRKVKVFIPPLAEQQTIAQFLDTQTAQIDALITEQNRLIELLTEQRKAVISHAVTKGLNPNAPMKKSGVEWLGEVPSHWQAVKFGQIFTENKIKNKGMIENNLLSLSYGNIIQKNIENAKGLVPENFETYQIVNPDDIIFRFTDLQNDKKSLRSAISKYRGIITSAYISVKLKKDGNADFFNYLFRAYDLMKVFYSMGDGMRQSLKMDELNRLILFVPPLAEQNEIVAYIETQTAQIDALITEQKELIERLKEYRTALISAAVTGKIDVQAA